MSFKRTDLAVELREIYEQESGRSDIDGVYTSEKQYGGVTLSRVYIADAKGGEALGKPVGHYSTLTLPANIHRHHESFEVAISILVSEISRMTQLPEDKTVLIAGLGNQNITADALGPKVAKHILVTRHLFEETPDELQNGLRPVAAISPGVLGLTGIETAEIIRGVTDRVKPDMIIAVDALAGRNVERISRTIQLADSGIVPGSGVNNSRSALTHETLGVPVIALGAPTVIDASTIAREAIDVALDKIRQVSETQIDLSEQDKSAVVNDLLFSAFSGRLVVTPKDIDALIDDISLIIANAINIALHKSLTLEDINKYKN